MSDLQLLVSQNSAGSVHKFAQVQRDPRIGVGVGSHCTSMHSGPPRGRAKVAKTIQDGSLKHSHDWKTNGVV